MEINTTNAQTILAKRNQSGQSFVEFILLLAGISIISFSFMKSINSNTAQKWLKISEVILNNGAKSGTPNYQKLKFP